MQTWNWVRMNANGTIDLDVSLDPETSDWRHMGRATVRHLRRYGTWLEEADDVTSAFERQARNEAGYTDDVRVLMGKIMESGMEDLDGADIVKAPDAANIQRLYISAMQRWLLSDDNPYPAIYVAVLSDASLMDDPLDAEMDTGDLPTWAFGQELITQIVQHWQQVPFAGGTAASPTQPTPVPNREARRAAPRKKTP